MIPEKFLEIVLLPSTNTLEVAANLITADETHKVFIRSSNTSLISNNEAWVSLSLMKSMARGYTITLHGTISKRYLESLPVIQDILSTWYPLLKPQVIQGAEPIEIQPERQKRVGCFFSGGLDSWYTFLKHKDEITDLIFVLGYDITFNQTALYSRAKELIQKIGNHYGKNVILIETNLRDFADAAINYYMIYGAAIAFVGHTLSNHLSKIFIASTHTYADLIPMGSHPLLDPLWSTEALEFVHDGCEASRVNKIRAIIDSPMAMETLRVCWKNPHESYNCGKCEKCIRTLIALQAVGATNRCKTFNNNLNLWRVLTMVIPDESVRRFVKENLVVLKNQPHNRRLYNAVRVSLFLSKILNPVKKAMRPAKLRFKKKYPKIFRNISKILGFA